MRCPDCNKYASMDFQDPEIEDSAVDENGNLTLTVRLSRNCTDCGTELKGATLELSCEVDVGDCDGHDLEVAQEEAEQIEEGGSRYAKSFFGAKVTGIIRCRDCDKMVADFEVSDKIAASEMEETA